MNYTNKLMASLLAISSAGVVFIMQHEGTKYEAYLDSAGIPTICTGHTNGVYMGQKATKADCERFLLEDLEEATQAVKRCTKVPITQEQYDTLVSFTFNVGGHAYCTSTLARKLNQGDCRGSAEEFKRWNRAGGRVVNGLKARRADEREVFLKGCA